MNTTRIGVNIFLPSMTVRSLAPSNSFEIAMRLRRKRMTPLSFFSMSSWLSKT